MADGADLFIYDPKVEDSQVRLDLATPKFEWDHPVARAAPVSKEDIKTTNDPMEAAKGSHAI